ncbi:MAG TPA: N-acetylmuramoyl-L-alanine amidase, partial [Bacteroidia bacterium]
MTNRIFILLLSALVTAALFFPSGTSGARSPKATVSDSALTNINKTLSSGTANPFPFGIKTVVIDPGHGGKDPGCLGKNLQEKDIALAVSLKLGKYIEQKIPDVKVIYTRTTDAFVELDERAVIANKNKADLFICIHCNTACVIDKKTKKRVCNEEVHGTETYVMGLHKTNANLNVAKRENSSILLEKNYQKHYDGFDPNSETGYILLTMQQNAYLLQSMNFAGKVQKQVKDKAGRLDKGVQQAGFLVLWRTAMPSVLIETEFLSGTESEKFIGSEKGQDYFARAVFIAFRQYKDEVEGKLAKYDDDVETAPPFIPGKDTVVPIKSEKKIQNEAKKDSILKMEPVIDKSDDKVKVAPKDTVSVKQIYPPIKIDSSKMKVIVKSKTDSTAVRKDTAHAIISPTKETGIMYKIQFFSSGTRVPLLSDKFKGLRDVGEYQDGTSYKYTAGDFKTMNEANRYRNE